jgi:hypothetical protein
LYSADVGQRMPARDTSAATTRLPPDTVDRRETGDGFEKALVREPMKDAKMKYSRANTAAGQSQADLQSSTSAAPS